MSCSVPEPYLDRPVFEHDARDVLAVGQPEPRDVEARARAGGDALPPKAPSDGADAVGPVRHLVLGLPAVALAVECTAEASVAFVRYQTLTKPSVSP